MNIAAVYLLHRFFYRLTDFFYHWYMDGSRFLFHAFISTLERLDRIFAVKITLRHFFEPLYQDYSVIGRIVGVVFRTLRISLGFGAYVLVGAVFSAIYGAWLALPVVIIGYAFYKA